MTKTEVLYSDIPPTKLRNRKEKFRKAQNNPFWTWVGDNIFFFKMLEHRFYSLKIKNKELFNTRNPNYTNIFYTPHCNWWDGVVGYNLIRRVFNLKLRIMIEELNRFPLLAQVGAFPVNKKSPQDSMKALKYIVDDLKKPDMGLWIFPQGIIRPPNYRPIEFQTGMTYIAQNIAKKHGGVNLIPLAVNYVFLREDRPEVLVEVGEPIIINGTDPKTDRHELTKQLQQKFSHLCDKQLCDISNGNIEGYRYLFKQKLPWYKKLEKKLKKVEIKGSGI